LVSAVLRLERFWVTAFFVVTAGVVTAGAVVTLVVTAGAVVTLVVTAGAVVALVVTAGPLAPSPAYLADAVPNRCAARGSGRFFVSVRHCRWGEARQDCITNCFEVYYDPVRSCGTLEKDEDGSPMDERIYPVLPRIVRKKGSRVPIWIDILFHIETLGAIWVGLSDRFGCLNSNPGLVRRGGRLLRRIRRSSFWP